MDSKCYSCDQLSLIEDYHEGQVVCSSCGLVNSPLFLNQIDSVNHQHFEAKDLTEIKHLLDRIHVPLCYAYHVESFYSKNFTIKSKQSLVFAIYKVLNDLGIPISMKEISNISNVNKKRLNKAQHENNHVNFDQMVSVEKYCKMLNLSYTTVTLIKNKLKTLPMSGHNPNSALASIIYQICKEHKLKISIKKVSEVTNVSAISIQRYNNFLKN
jgi:transcription initiation factor TFIIIB Brf1 subunit/transcription initiation factor TFIIB